MPKFDIGEGESNRLKLLVSDVRDILKSSTTDILKKLRDNKAVTIGYNKNQGLHTTISIHLGEVNLPYPARADIMVLVNTKGTGDSEHMSNLIDATSAVYDEIIDVTNRRTENDWILVSDQLKWVPIEMEYNYTPRTGDRSILQKAYSMILEYEWGGTYSA